MKNVLRLVSLVAAVVLILVAGCFGQEFVAIDAGPNGDTYPTAINEQGRIIGTFQGDSGVHQGFVRKKDGSFVFLTAGMVTYFNAINAKGQIVGFPSAEDVPPYGPINGFLLQPDGTMVGLWVERYAALPTDINAAGVIVGFYYKPELIGDYYDWGPSHVFLRRPNGTTKTMNTPESAFAVAINPSGTVVGGFSEGSRNHGFVWESNQPKGNITSFDPLGSINTDAKSINTAGRVVGCYTDANRVIHGFVRERDGAITSFDVGSNYTCAIGINAAGYIIGEYSDEDRVTHGFLRRPDGSTSSIAVGPFNTHLTGINEAGYIVGYYTDENSRTHGFLRRK